MEKHVSIETEKGIIRGVWHSLSPLFNSKFVIVFVHGYFSANKIGPARLYVEMARYLCSYGYSVLRCDALGVGESDGNFIDVTFESELKDFEEVCNYAKKIATRANLIFIGHSMGANLVIQLSKEINKIAGVVLLSPGLRLIGGLKRLFNYSQLKDLKEKGWTIRKGLYINQDWVTALQNSDILDTIKMLSCPLTILQGDLDELYDPAGAVQLVLSNKSAKLIMIRGEDHNYMNKCRVKLFEKIEKEVNRFVSLNS